MSIWCSWPHIGTGYWEKRNRRGTVLSYAEGFSNHYPDRTGTHERPAGIALAHIPQWCVPGHDSTEDYDVNGPWLRLEVDAPETVSFWKKDADGNPIVKPQGATVVLNERAARELRDDLTRWLDRPKARPRRSPSPSVSPSRPQEGTTP